MRNHKCSAHFVAVVSEVSYCVCPVSTRLDNSKEDIQQELSCLCNIKYCSFWEDCKQIQHDMIFITSRNFSIFYM